MSNDTRLSNLTWWWRGSIEQFVPQLVELLTREHNPNIMLLAARALTNLMEVHFDRRLNPTRCKTHLPLAHTIDRFSLAPPLRLYSEERRPTW